MDKQLALPGYQYPEMQAEERQLTASALLGLAMEEPVLYMPSFADLAGDVYAGYFLSWFIKNCRYGKSIVISDEEMSALFGFSKSRWHSVRRTLKGLNYLTVKREGGQSHYSLNESYFSNAQRQSSIILPAIPIERITAAAMLDKGLRMQDVLFYSVVREQQPYLPPEQRDSYSNWFEHNNVQQQRLAVLTTEEQLKAINGLYKAGLLQVEQLRQLNIVRYRIDYDAASDLAWQYIHTKVEAEA